MSDDDTTSTLAGRLYFSISSEFQEGFSPQPTSAASSMQTYFNILRHSPHFTAPLSPDYWDSYRMNFSLNILKLLPHARLFIAHFIILIRGFWLQELAQSINTGYYWHFFILEHLWWFLWRDDDDFSWLPHLASFDEDEFIIFSRLHFASPATVTAMPYCRSEAHFCL